MNTTGRFFAHGSVLLAPLLYAQGLYTRSKISRLPEAAGPRSGRVAGGASVLRLLLLGESTVAGVGAASHDEGLAGQAAGAVSAMTGSTVDWRVHAANGVTAAGLRASLNELPPDTRADLIVVGLGANDVFRLQGPVGWERDLQALIDDVRERCGFAPVILCAMPPIGHFPGLPQPLRSVLGLRAKLLDHATEKLAGRKTSVHYLPFELEMDPALFSADGIHPSTQCYALWGDAIARLAIEHLPARG
ncbi:MAG: SGNH/GDSL hydrolase family protein [Gammaproteobacteria bacterium]|nr:SGNH/GDSL hydrolase family protein [Gammaproteobacteria bacterium]NNF60815.1 SGNH/GDSL hydrolase family protein [Gammaproteobacteria bacterium]NNM21720.1 SGNH/GDSL hydrolase family protein [Gammaproteobacteria bacterium]